MINVIERKGITLGRLLDQLVERCATVEMVDDKDLLHRLSLCRRLQDARCPIRIREDKLGTDVIDSLPYFGY